MVAVWEWGWLLFGAEDGSLRMGVLGLGLVVVGAGACLVVGVGACLGVYVLCWGCLRIKKYGSTS